MTFWCGSGSGSADPCLWLMDPDPDPGGPKTCGSGRSGFESGSATLVSLKTMFIVTQEIETVNRGTKEVCMETRWVPFGYIMYCMYFEKCFAYCHLMSCRVLHIFYYVWAKTSTYCWKKNLKDMTENEMGTGQYPNSKAKNRLLRTLLRLFF